MADGNYEDLWTPYKHLFSSIEKAISNPTKHGIAELEAILRKNKHNLINILRNPPKNEDHRKQLLDGITKGIDVRGKCHLILCKDLIDECLIMSDMFNLDEFIALELLCTAQCQMSQHPGLPRGLTAILLYYDGRKAIACALRDLFQARSGISWCIDAPNEVINLITSFTQTIVEESNLLYHITELLEDFDVSKELAMLTKNRALGPAKHRRQVLDLFEDTRLALSTALFNWSAQCGLPKAVVLRLFTYLSKTKPTEPTGFIDEAVLTILMCVLYAIDTTVLLRQEDKEPSVLDLPIMTEPDFAQTLFEFLSIENDWEWSNRLKSIIKFAFGITLASLRQTPHSIQHYSADIIDNDEHLVDEAISLKALDFMHFYLLESNAIYKNEFFCRRIHSIFTDFIVFMHSKVSELRGKADETARTFQAFFVEGLDPPSTLDHNFELLMLSIGKFYSRDNLNLSLCNEFWGPMDTQPKKSNKTPSRSVSLFKFVRMAGELLPPILFVPYLKMLSGLSNSEQSARNSFNLLKQGSVLSGSTTISWEHFFGSLAKYYSKLRQEHGPGTDTIYKNRIINRSINPQEIEGLCAVLEVVRTVSKHDELARCSLCEHPNWVPLHVLLGLISCSVPIHLKADILLTLATLSKSKDTATQLWNSLETSQIISTVPTANVYRVCGIEMEIEQNECRNETYPLTKAVLDLLYSLVSTFVPRNLGGGTRTPGLDPYLTFLIDLIFLKFSNRNYKNLAEKWEIGEKCLQLLVHFLTEYEIRVNDFAEQREENSPPGYHIMMQLHTKSDIFCLILSIVHEARQNLDEYHNFPGKKNLETCALHCLNVIEITLRKQVLFFESHSAAGSSAFLPGLNRILLDVNPRSGRPDHILNSTKFITYNSWLPKHSLSAIKILNTLARLPNVSSQILGMLTENEHLQMEIRHGFVECLEKDNITHCDGNNMNKGVHLEIKEAIFNLLKDCLNQPWPNVTHFLLGFDIARDIRLTQKQGLFHSPINCTKSLVLLLDRHLEVMKTSKDFNPSIESVIQKAYSVLYSLCYNQWTSSTILRFLRTCNDFLPRHLSTFIFRELENSEILIQISFLLKCTAIDLKLTSTNNQISRFQSLCEILVGTSSKLTLESTPLELNHYVHSMQKIPTSDNSTKQTNVRILICRLLECIDFREFSICPPKWDYFDTTLVGQILNSCQIKNEDGSKLINIKKLHDILYDELRTVQSTVASGQRQLIQQEIDSVVSYALKTNTQRSKTFAKLKFIEAWGQISEVMITCAPSAAMSVEVKQEIILEMVEHILNKVVPVQIPLELADLFSGTILLLLVNLRYWSTQNISKPPSLTDFGEVPAFRGNIYSISKKLNTLSLKFIVRNIIEWIIVSGKISQRLRINLYAALVNAMQIIKGGYSGNNEKESSELFVSRLDKSYSASENKTILEAKQDQLNMEFLTSFGDKIIEVLCNDCVGSHDICKMTAISCIDILLDFNTLSGFTEFIAKRGYLTHVISSLYKFDSSLCCVLHGTPENLRALYVYQSKMALLSRIANKYAGAELLLESKILGVLSAMKVFDMHPDLQGNSLTNQLQNEKYFPSVDTRYRQILYPALGLCDDIISTLGSENYSAMLQVTHFLVSHGDMIEVVLRAGSPYLDLGLLQELSIITGLIARTTNQETCSFFASNINRDIGTYVNRLRRLMISLLPRFIVQEKTLKKMFKAETKSLDSTKNNEALQTKLFLEISSNVCFYCRNVVVNHSVDQVIELMFLPKLSDSRHRYENTVESFETSPNLGVILNQLKGTVEYYNRQRSICESLVRQKLSLSNDAAAKAISYDLSERIHEKQNELSHCVFITENCLYLLWIHLDFYMRQSVTVNTYNYKSNTLGLYKLLCAIANFQEFQLSSFTVVSPSLESNFHITLDDIIDLKKNLVSTFNETFCQQLAFTSHSEGISDKGFTEALLRRIKCLTQNISSN